MPRSSGTKPSPARARSCAGSALRSRPARRMLPVICRCSPITQRSVVVFPAPLRPTSVMSCPSVTSNATSRSACAWPYQAERPLTSSIGLPQIRGDDRRVVPHGLVWPVSDHPTLLQDDDALRELGNDAHVVLDQKHRATRTHVPDERARPFHVVERHPGGRLVEEQHLRIERQG